MAGVNGSGKTTSSAKLAQRLKDPGRSIILGRWVGAINRPAPELERLRSRRGLTSHPSAAGVAGPSIHSGECLLAT
ncbi:MAG: hypothetical protein ACLP7Q_04610 [Isosphaeraceae bacterium]